MVVTGTLLGAGRRRADAVAMGWTAALIAAAGLGVIGTVLAIWPALWVGLFTELPGIADAAAAYLSRVGPAYAFFGLGLCLYFASQGMETLPIPVGGALLRIVIVAGGFSALSAVAALTPVNALWIIVVAMVAYGAMVGIGLWLGPWRVKVGREPAEGMG